MRWNRNALRPGWNVLLLAAWCAPGCVLSESSRQGLPEPEPAGPGFYRVVLNSQPGEPIGLAVLPDGRVLHTTRRGQVWQHEPSTGENRIVGQLPVYQHDEEGLQGIAIDPAFAENRWVYLYYSPELDTPLNDPETPENEGNAPQSGTEEQWEPFQGYFQLSRFQLNDSGLDLDSEQKILSVPSDRGICCHVGGDIDFDQNGNLLLSTGDDSNPFESGGYSPIDERPSSHPAFDAQRTAGSTLDLRGKLLRIRVEEDGTYSIPEGNLFPADMPLTRPEIYSMGLRNPFRFTVNRERGETYLADYAPDAMQTTAARGPRAEARFIIIQQAANYGWPYCMGQSLAYTDYDFETLQSAEPFDCQQPTNDSPRNTGLQQLPPVTNAALGYSYARSTQWPALGSGGVAPMAGPVYHFDPSLQSDVQWPEQYDDVVVFYEWARDNVHFLTVDSSLGTVLDVGAPRLDFVVDNPIDMEFGPDGALYVLNYGDGYFRENPDASLVRFEYRQAPAATESP